MYSLNKMEKVDLYFALKNGSYIQAITYRNEINDLENQLKNENKEE